MPLAPSADWPRDKTVGSAHWLCPCRDGLDRERRFAIAALYRPAKVREHGGRIPLQCARREVQHVDTVCRHVVVPPPGPLLILRAHVILTGVNLGGDARSLPPRVRDAEEGAVCRV